MDQEVKLIMKQCLWDEVYNQLKARGKGETESGAFLLGPTGDAHITAVAYYDDLEAGCLDSGSVHLTFLAFMGLTDICRVKQLTVKADVHTHPSSIIRLSGVDRKNPLIKIKGHIALIVPYYALPPVCDLDMLGIHEFLGGGFNWKTHEYNDGILKIVE
jgi:proteasome lid subunit RPN8/RPN11